MLYAKSAKKLMRRHKRLTDSQSRAVSCDIGLQNYIILYALLIETNDSKLISSKSKATRRTSNNIGPIKQTTQTTV